LQVGRAARACGIFSENFCKGVGEFASIEMSERSLIDISDFG
jgi:hypothetical protein